MQAHALIARTERQPGTMVRPTRKPLAPSTAQRRPREALPSPLQLRRATRLSAQEPEINADHGGRRDNQAFGFCAKRCGKGLRACGARTLFADTGVDAGGNTPRTGPSRRETTSCV
jgi:hypothetical protein